MNKTILKRLTAGAVALAMAATLVPSGSFFGSFFKSSLISASAEGEVEVDSWMGIYNAINSTQSGESKTIKLTGDCVSQSGPPINVSNGQSITIDLNGYSIDRGLAEATEPNGAGFVLNVSGGSELTIEDSSTDGTGTITGGYNATGGGVGIIKGTLNINGGSITGNRASLFGGGVYIYEEGTVNLNGGNISGNTAVSVGGGVCVNGTLNISGGSITGNTTSVNTGNDGNGGGVYVESGTMAMTDGSISNNTADSGGGIFIAFGSFTLSGGSISSNTANWNGGGIFLRYDDDKSISISGAVIKENTAESGGGIYALNSDTKAQTLPIKNTVITKNKATNGSGGGLYSNCKTVLDGVTITENDATEDGGGVVLNRGDSDHLVTEKTIISGNTKNGTAAQSNLYLGGSTKLITEGLDKFDSSIGISMESPGKFTNNSNNIYYDFGENGEPFFADDPRGFKVVKVGDSDVKLEASKGYLSGYRMVMSDTNGLNIGLSFIATFPERSSGASYILKVNDEVVAEDTIPYNYGSHTFTIKLDNLLAKQMTDKVTCIFYNGTDEPETFETSVYEYAQVILANEDNIAEYTAAQPIVKAALLFGGYSQKQFGYNTKNLASKGVEYDFLPSGKTFESADKDVQDYKAFEGAHSTDAGISYYASSLLLKTNITQRHYFKIEEGGAIGNYKFKIGNSYVEPKRYNETDYYYIDRTGIAAYDLDVAVTITVEKDSEAVMTFSYCPFDYVASVLSANSTMNDKTKNTVRSLYWYFVEAFKRAYPDGRDGQN